MESTIDGLKIYYTEEGEGPQVVLLHGWGSNCDLYKELSHFLSKRYHVVAPNFPGCGSVTGNSDEPKESWSVSDYIRFTVHFTQQFIKSSDEKVIFFGHSHGGRVLIKMCGMEPGEAMKREIGIERLPFDIDKLVLVDSAGIVPVKTKAQLEKVKRYKTYKAILSTPVMKTLFPGQLEKLQSHNGSVDYRSASPMMRQCMVKVVNEDERDYMPNIKSSTLLIWGVNDTATPIADGEYMEKHIPGSGLVRIERAGHFSFLDQQLLFLKVIGSFLNVPFN